MPNRAALALAIWLAAAPAADAAPRVVASIPPVHGLVASVMEGAGAPHLLIPADASPHHFALKPSDARALAEADLVFTVGAGLEGGLAEAAARLAEGARLVALAELPGLETLPARAAAHGHGARTPGHDAEDDDPGEEADGHGERAHGEGDEGHDRAGSAGEAAIDPHLWLDPANAAHWLDAIAATLAEADPENAALYRANAATAAAELDTLTAGLEALLAPYAGRDYAVFHEAFRHFERRFGLRPAASLASVAGVGPGARGVARLGERVAAMEAPCLFAEPQHDAALVERIARDSGVRTGTLDPIGSGIPLGPDFYPQLVRGLARDFARCLDAAARDAVSAGD